MFLKGSGWANRLWFHVQGENDDTMIIRDVSGGFVRINSAQAAEILPHLTVFAEGRWVLEHPIQAGDAR